MCADVLCWLFGLCLLFVICVVWFAWFSGDFVWFNSVALLVILIMIIRLFVYLVLCLLYWYFDFVAYLL